MTSPTSVDIPKPIDWQAFERLTRAVFSEANQANFNRFGRVGQRQNGIDVIGHLLDGTLVGIQCKGRTTSLGKRITKTDIDKAIKDAETYPGKLEEFFIVTTADEDVVLQQYVIQLSGVRKASSKFGVTLWGWQSMSDQIRSCPGVLRTFYPEWWMKPSFMFLASLIGVAAIFGIISLTGSQRLEQWFSSKDASRHTTVEGLQTVSTTLDQLQNAYGNCIASMSGKAFVFSGQLRSKCVKPIEAPLKRLQQQRDRLAAVMNTDAFNEVVAAKGYLEEDFRQLLIAVDMAQYFEKSAVEVAKTMCPKEKFKASGQNQSNDEFQKSGKDALSAQMSRYFEIRDFVIPAITSLKARLAISARTQNGQDVPEDLVQQANSLTDLLKQERAYVYKPTPSPFTMARVKEMSSRNITMTGDSSDVVEELVWQQTAEEAMFEGIKTHPADVEYLISCGMLKPSARALKKESEAP